MYKICFCVFYLFPVFLLFAITLSYLCLRLLPCIRLHLHLHLRFLDLKKNDKKVISFSYFGYMHHISDIRQTYFRSIPYQKSA